MFKLHRVCVRNRSSFASVNYVSDIYFRWLSNPKSVHKSWDTYFSKEKKTAVPAVIDVDVDRCVAVNKLIDSYRNFGHREAKTDPLGISRADNYDSPAIELNPQFHGLDLNAKLNGFGGQFETVGELNENLKRMYCGKVGVEYTYLHDWEQRNWLKSKIESRNHVLDAESRRIGLKSLMKTSLFEEYTAQQYRFETVFFAEGCESFVPALTHIIDASSRNGVEDFVIGIAHRGRSAIVCNVLNHDLVDFFKLFNPKIRSFREMAGDSKYHLGGYYTGLNEQTNRPIRISLLSNSSHLESINPIAQGRVASLQLESGDFKGDKSLCILIHGDAAMSGQGVTYESAQMSNLRGFTTHGVVHIVANNQLGFTAERPEYCSSAYCTDVLRTIDAPVFHVNADDVDSILYVSDLAAQWRNSFRKDIVIDVVGYRKYGHNEGDDPKPTQPVMYKLIENRKSILGTYSDRLIADGIVDRREFEQWKNDYSRQLETANNEAKKIDVPCDKIWWDIPDHEGKLVELKSTGIEKETLNTIANVVCQAKDETGSFKPTKVVSRLLSRRLNQFQSSGQVDFALAEAFAFGSLLMDGKNIRLTGQDCERGTFAHRHCVIHDDQQALRTRVPLNELPGRNGNFTALNSSLSECAVLGHQYGYSLQRPDTICIWEAQYGDFANNAQCIIDQYLVSGAEKWHHQSGLVMLLPHGMDGGGPEHSSSRPERYLQMTNEPFDGSGDVDPSKQIEHSNFVMVNCTTTANYFHMFRRHALQGILRPLIVMSPKSLLRNEHSVSPIEHFLPGTQFKTVIDEAQSDGSAEKLAICSGKVYYDLTERRKALGMDERNLRIVRIEQITPFPAYELKKVIETNEGVRELIWVQEEHQNMGAYSYVRPKIEKLLADLGRSDLKLKYAGRKVSSTPVTANKAKLNEEKEEFLFSVYGSK